MKKKYIKTPEGVLVSATAEQVADVAIEKFEVEVPDPVPQDDPMKALANEIRALATDTKGAVDKMNAQFAAYEKAREKGFPLGGPTPPDGTEGRTQFENLYERNAKMAGMTVKEAHEFFGEYDLAIQGRELMDKFTHPNHVIDEAKRIEMAKFYCLMFRARNDPRAMAKFIDTYGTAKTPIGESGNTFPLPKPIEAEILAFAREASVILQYARIWPMTSDKMGIPAESSSVTVSWGQTTPSSDPGATEVELEANELSAYSTVKNTTLNDAISDIVSWINSVMAEAAGLELDNQGFNGTGTPFYGLLGSSGAGYSVVLSGSLISGLTATDLSNMIAKLDGLKKQGARWFQHGQIFHYIRSLKDDNGRPIFVDSVGSPVPGSVWGYPYTETIKAPSTQAANTAYILFGNMRYFGLGRRLDVATLNVNPYLYWTTNRTCFKLYQRWGMKVGLRNGFCRLLTST